MNETAIWGIYHDIDLLAHFSQHGIIRNSYPFEHMLSGVVDWVGRLYDVDMGKSTFTRRLQQVREPCEARSRVVSSPANLG